MARENGSILFSPGSSFTGNSNTFLPPLPHRPPILDQIVCSLAPAPAHSGNHSLIKIQSLNRMAFGCTLSLAFLQHPSSP